MKQYEIVLVNLEPTVGSEIKKIRPCAIVSPFEMNQYLKTIVIAPMTTTLKKVPTRVEVFHDGKHGMIAIDQIRTIDKSRVIKSIGKLSKKEIADVKQVVQAAFVDE